jgi:hypothetical protein
LQRSSDQEFSLRESWHLWWSRFFRREFARDAFLAAFRYVLPSEFKREIERIIKFDLIAERQKWVVKIEKVDDGHVLVTTDIERVFRNKSNAPKPVYTYYEAEDYGFPHGPTRIVECGIQIGGEEHTVTGPDISLEHGRELKTETYHLQPGATAKIWGKTTQYRRVNDAMYETFRMPIVNPEIEVIVDDKVLSHIALFGAAAASPKDVTKSKFGNHYVLSGVYFPGQHMLVRWWPKKQPTLNLSLPELSATAAADPAR